MNQELLKQIDQALAPRLAIIAIQERKLYTFKPNIGSPASEHDTEIGLSFEDVYTRRPEFRSWYAVSVDKYVR